MKKLKMTLRTTIFLIAFTTIANMSFAQCWFVDDATNSVCMTDPANSCIPITYPDGSTAFSIEALSIDPSGSPVYASDGGQVGILDPISGLFTPFANPSGYTDIDGLAWDPNTNKLFASVRLVNQNDLLVCIEISGPNAGLPVAGTQVAVTGSGIDVDELTVPPNSCSNAGIIFATIDIGGSFVLATIDPASGVATEIGPIGIPDVESITFDANCNLYGNTGTGALYLLDQDTGAAIGDPILNVNGNDVEGMSCESSTPFGASISNYIWEDTNGDGVQGAGEDPIAGVLVNLLDAAGNPVLDPAGNPITAVTDANGEYLFDNLPAGDYIVEIDPSNFTAGGALEGYAQTFDEDGGDDGQIAVSLDANEDHTTADFGFQGTGTIGDTIFEDLDGDGVQGPGEMGIAGVTVELFDDMGISLGTTMTDANGNYIFENLPAGDYTVTVTPPAGYTNTGDPDGTFDSTTDVTLGAGEMTTVEDFGYQGSGSIGDLIWEDLNGDGVVDPGEMGMAGVTVELKDSLCVVIATTMTDANGNYIFDNLPPGDYTILVTSPAGFDNTGDPDGTMDNTSMVTLAPDGIMMGQDFGYDMIVVAVDIMFFNAKKNNKYVDLEWGLAYVGDLDYVEIQHSMDGVNYQAVKNGDSDLIAYTHTKTKAGSNYYRLVFHEYNGEITISNTKVIRFAQAEVIKIYPTLVSKQLNIDGAIINQYAIFGLDGKLIKQGLNDANGYQTIDLLDLPDGNYMIRMKSSSGQVLSKQFVKIN